MHIPDALVFVYVSAIRGQLVVYTQLHNQEVNWPLEACLATHPDSGFAKESWQDTKQAICEANCNQICLQSKEHLHSNHVTKQSSTWCFITAELGMAL